MISLANNTHHDTVSQIYLEISFIMTVKVKVLSTYPWCSPSLTGNDSIFPTGEWILVETLSYISGIASIYFNEIALALRLS